MGLLQDLKSFPRTFWVANTVELFERWAWYGMFMVLGLYMINSPETGALGFTNTQKGTIMGVVTSMVYFLPFFTGALADKFGYKKMLIFAFAFYFTGFILMAHLRGFWSFFFAYGVVGLGAAFFKPIVSATVSKTTTPKNSSVGFGIFYMMVNLGAFLGPIFSAAYRQVSWQTVFYISAGIIAVNTLLVILLYKEPGNDEDNKQGKTLTDALEDIVTVFKDLKFLVFLLLIIGFWTMYNQLFYSLPIFIDQWSDTSVLYDWLHGISPWLAEKLGNVKEGIIPAEIITNVDAFYIIIFQIAVSYFVKRFRPLNAMISGIFVSTIGISLSFMFNNPFYYFLTILIFGLGEMASSPKITEYIGLIAPSDKKALYMGMSFLPLAGGNFLAGIISGPVFGKMSDKYELLKRLLAEKNISFNAEMTKQQLWDFALQKLNISGKELTQLLWSDYKPFKFWTILFVIGLSTVIGLFVYDRIVNKSKNITDEKTA